MTAVCALQPRLRLAAPLLRSLQVRVIVSGNQEPRSVDITQAAVDAGAEELSRRCAPLLLRR